MRRTITAHTRILINNPDDPTGAPAFDGKASDASKSLTAGDYAATIDCDGLTVSPVAFRVYADGTWEFPSLVRDR